MNRRPGPQAWVLTRARRLGVVAVIALIFGTALQWRPEPARAASFARYVDGVRPAVVFVWSDPTLGHPHG